MMTSRERNQKSPKKTADRLQAGIVYGLVSGALAIVILLGFQTLYLQEPSFAIVGYMSLGVLSIASGVLSSRASGSLLSAAIAGGILGIYSFLTCLSIHSFVQIL